jgi:UDP-2,4-diacetamido-2,4,6-trideoxy-beta-L-altropyranose hydrolase
MTTKIAIRCNTDANKGYGNFTRCITLAKSLKKYSLSPIFLIDDNKIIKSELKKYKISYHLLKKYNHIEESKEINILLTKKNIKFLILDLREKSETLSRQLMKYNFKTILIDDAFCTNIYSDIVFNGTIVKSFQNYNYINNDTLKFLGPKYFLSESGFSKFSKKSNDIVNKKIFTIVVSFGGSDPTNLTLTVLKQISLLSNIKIIVILGPFFKNKKKIYDFCKYKKNLHIKNSPSNIWNIFHKSDVAITKGGLTLYELSIMGIPTICIDAFDHEQISTLEFSKKNFSINLGMLYSKQNISIDDSLAKLLKNLSKRKKINSCGKKIVDGKGLMRTSKIIKNFTKKTIF